MYRTKNRHTRLEKSFNKRKFYDLSGISSGLALKIKLMGIFDHGSMISNKASWFSPNSQKQSICLLCFQLLSLGMFAQGDFPNGRTFMQDSLLGIKYFNLADSSYEDVDKCMYYTDLAIPLLKKTGQWEKYIYCLNGLSYCYNIKEYYDSMEANNLLALKTAEEFLEKDNPVYIAAVNNLAFVYGRIKQDHKKALVLYKKALSQFNENNIHFAVKGTLLNNSGHVYRQIGDFDQAILHHKEALRHFQQAFDSYIKKTSNTYFKFAEVYTALAKLYEFKTDYGNALYYLEEELTLLNNNKKQYDKSYFVYLFIDIARLSIKQSKYNKAEYYLKQVRSFSPLTPNQLSKFYSVYASLSKSNGKLNKAIIFINKAINNTTDEQVIEKARLLHLKSKIILSQRKHALAAQTLEEAITFLVGNYSSGSRLNEISRSSNIKSKLDLLQILNTKAQILLGFHEKNKQVSLFEEALMLYRTISSLSDQIRQNYQSEESKIFLNETTHQFYDEAISVIYKLYQATGNKDYIQDGLFFAEKSKSIALLDELLHKDAEKFFAIPTSIQERYYQLRTEINYYNKLLNQDSDKEDSSSKVQEWNSQLLRAKQEYEGLSNLLKDSYPNYYQFTQPKIIPIAEIQHQLLKPGQAFIEYFIGEKKAYIFVVSKEDIQWHEIDEPAEVINQVEVLLKNLKLFEEKDAFVNSSHFLFRELIKPINIQEDISQLLIVPDDQLTYLPFELLLKEKPDNHNPKSFPFLVRDFSISYTYSGSILLNQHKSQTKSSRILAIAPVFDNQASKYLKYSEDELNTLMSLNADVLEKSEAKKDSFLSRWKNYDILHIASHATSSDLILKQPTIDFWDEKLFLTDLYTYNAAPHLVVLSACESGIGDYRQGEGVMSLARGFTYAGAQSLVTTLWKVNDKSTSGLVESFYHFLNKGFTKDEALRQAKLKYLENCPDNKAAPFYWASFVQLGDNRAMDLGSEKPVDRLLMGTGVLFIVLILYLLRSIKNSQRPETYAGA